MIALKLLLLAIQLLTFAGISLQPATPATKPEATPADQPAAPAKTPGTPGTPTTTATTPTPAKAVEGPKASFANADELLTALETADAGLRTLRADVRYDKIFEDQGDRQTRLGRLFFENAAVAPAAGEEKAVPSGVTRRFALLIDELQLGARREEKLQQLIFDGEFFVEKVPADRRFTKRRIAKPGDTFDPFKVGEGQFPLPIGQKKADILSRFDAVLLKDTEELAGDTDEETADLTKFVAGTYQLRLTIKPELRAASEMREIRLWYRSEVAGDGTMKLLPRLARTTHRGGTLSLVRMINVRMNQPFEGNPFDASLPPGDWEISVQDDVAVPEGR
jgi:hypothetical protein